LFFNYAQQCKTELFKLSREDVSEGPLLVLHGKSIVSIMVLNSVLKH